MKKIILTVIALIIATTTFALPPPKVSPPKHGGGPGKIVFRKDIFQPSNKSSISKSPNSQMANAVAISGFIATGLRMLQQVTNPPQPTIIVFPEGVEGPVIIKEQEPVVTHPVPITVMPIEIMKSH